MEVRKVWRRDILEAKALNEIVIIKMSSTCMCLHVSRDEEEMCRIERVGGMLS